MVINAIDRLFIESIRLMYTKYLSITKMSGNQVAFALMVVKEDSKNKLQLT